MTDENISPYCVTYFEKNTKARLLQESAERKGGRHVYEEPEQTITNETIDEKSDAKSPL